MMGNFNINKKDCEYTFEVFKLNNTTECHDKEICMSNKSYTYDEWQNGTLLTDAKQMLIDCFSKENADWSIEINIWNCQHEEWEEEIELKYWTIFEKFV